MVFITRLSLNIQHRGNLQQTAKPEERERCSPSFQHSDTHRSVREERVPQIWLSLQSKLQRFIRVTRGEMDDDTNAEADHAAELRNQGPITQAC